MATSTIQSSRLEYQIDAYKLTGQNFNTITITFPNKYYGAIAVFSDYGIAVLYKHNSAVVEKLGSNNINMSVDSTGTVITITMPYTYPNGFVLWQRTNARPTIVESNV